MCGVGRGIEIKSAQGCETGINPQGLKQKQSAGPTILQPPIKRVGWVGGLK